MPLLSPHSDFPAGAVARIEATAALAPADRLVLSYVVSGQIGDIRLPPVASAERGEELWRHTCFEVFIRDASGPGYYEFNFAPSTKWAAYRFSGYRSGMVLATEIDAVSIEAQSSVSRYTLQASVPIGRLSRKNPWHLGLSALIEDQAGHMSYWALAHPPGKPDFHHQDCFAHEFAPAVSA